MINNDIIIIILSNDNDNNDIINNVCVCVCNEMIMCNMCMCNV